MPKCPRFTAAREITLHYSIELINIRFQFSAIKEEIQLQIVKCKQSICQYVDCVSMSLQVAKWEYLNISECFFFSFRIGSWLVGGWRMHYRMKIFIGGFVLSIVDRYSDSFSNENLFYRNAHDARGKRWRSLLTTGKDGKSKNDSIHVPFGIFPRPHFFCPIQFVYADM